jgi:hypothetical protein
MDILGKLRFESFYELVFYSIIVFYILIKDIKALYKNDIKVRLISGMLLLFTINLYLNILFSHYKTFVRFIFQLGRHIHILIYWVILLVIGLYLIELSKPIISLKVIRRKLYHFLALLIYIPGFVYLNDELLLSISGLVFALFLLIEKLRNNKMMRNLFPWIDKLSDYLKSNIDDRDKEKLILTHTFLLFSCFYTLLMVSLNNNNDYIKPLGLIVLSVGDSMVILY